MKGQGVECHLFHFECIKMLFGHTIQIKCMKVLGFVSYKEVVFMDSNNVGHVKH